MIRGQPLMQLISIFDMKTNHFYQLFLFPCYTSSALEVF
ncbi:hypothetical protein LKF67_1241 [Lactococcus lactis subsp. lactis]|nr:hypothetical protein LKF67_1241 [Lactococcus lactis subsp. lactis]